jgi:hypothetical protein
VKSLLLRRTANGTAQLRVLLKGNVGAEPLTLVPPNLGTEAGVLLDDGNGTRYCMRLGGPAGGLVKRNDAKQFLVLTTESSPAIEVGCPTPGTGGLGVRYVYGNDSSASGFDLQVAAGFTTIDLGAYLSELEALPDGTQALVWLGDYDNTTCTWERSDDWIVTHVGAIAGHPKIAGYFIADEPHLWDCPNAPADVQRRSQLVKSVDPNPPTLVVIEPQSQSPGNPYAPYVGMADVIGVERYPCSLASGCVFSKIDDQIALAEAAGIPRYWALIQAFGTPDYYRLPTAEELHEEFRHWRASRMEGYMVFAWSWKDNLLEDHPDLLQALWEENAQ